MDANYTLYFEFKELLGMVAYADKNKTGQYNDNYIWNLTNCYSNW